MLNSLPTVVLGRFERLRASAGQLINARPMYWLCVVQSVIGLSGSPPVAFARTDHVGRPIARRHPLTLIVLFHALAHARAES